MKILFIGDVVGSPGREMITEHIKGLKQEYKPTVTIINGENAAHGKGITEKIYKGFLAEGAQAVTLGNHSWDKKEIFSFIEDATALVRPANYPEGTPGVGYRIIQINQVKLAVINLLGRTFMNPVDCPFKKVDDILAEMNGEADVIFVDFHAETTSEKQAMGWYLDGRVSAVIGTHTHVQTADERILPQGTAYLSDVGMTGPLDGILGMDRHAVLHKFLTSMPVRFEVAEGKRQLNACIITINDKTMNATSIKRITRTDEQTIY
ncbi:MULTISPECIES: TIGR00282 family metallophosphoesterase [Shouchella]|uniref:TIGR00282 family metallophosphoesterase n=2 Tax=Shouchella TaxID=2893057 RepID=A0ABY7W770_9BACI|nr:MULTISPECIES: TIGR00282 family metallophosphoesterase [Shouchella]MED4127223.1 TIGR00282 family metallophosphoesterase [Shouchella miscanthi]WDF03702.1 TIGR00282 family metallophosphoesterase [Shouchella hunanensis]